MKENIFSYVDYKAYLGDWIRSQANDGYGAKMQIAKSLRTTSSHVSQVLNSNSHLTSEQAENLAEHMGLNSEQCEYFQLLIQLARASSDNLRKRLSAKVSQMQASNLDLSKRFNIDDAISEREEAKFYSSYLYVAAHILLTIEKYNSSQALSKRLGIPTAKAQEIIDFFIKIGLARAENGKYKIGVKRIHLGQDSPLLIQHHRNWRLHSILKMDRDPLQDSLRYSATVSISEKDAVYLRSELVKAIDSFNQTVKNSPEEEAYFFTMDFGRL